MVEPELIIDAIPSGSNGKATVTAKLGEHVLYVDKLDISQAKFRQQFAKELCGKHSGIDPEAIEAELLSIAARQAKATPSEPPTAEEIDQSRIARPERFIRPEVSGLTVPTMIERDGKPAGRWMLYLQWADGKREAMPLPEFLAIGDSRLWIHPTPAEPAKSMPSGWSIDARRRWLAGKAAPNPVDVFKSICEQIAFFIDLPAERAAGVTAKLALWSMLSYCYPAWDAVPYLYLGGPAESGKSTVFAILTRLCFRPFGSSNLTAPALFRTLHNQGGTLLFDEAEKLRQMADPTAGELNSMLLAGYKHGGQATRLEPIGDSFKQVNFDVYGPKALACIAGLPPPLASRCIPVLMFRASPNSQKPRRRIDADPERWICIRDDLHALALEHGSTWLELAARTDVCPAMSGREFELWQPLLALAWWLQSQGASGLLKLLQEYAIDCIASGKDEKLPDADATLLRLLADAVRSGERIAPHELLSRAQEQEPATFKQWSPEGVSRRLKTYGIPKAAKSGGRREFRDATPELLRRIQANYGIDLDFPARGEPAADG